MSPEILAGKEFDLPTDIFSLGIILCEIASRTVADDYHFRRAAPTFGVDPEEVRNRACPGCPDAFIKLCLDCLAVDPISRPTTRVILDRLREIEAEVMSRPSEADDLHIGSVRFMATNKRPGVALRIPSFGTGVGKGISGDKDQAKSSDDETTSSDEELMEAVMGLNDLTVGDFIATNGT